MLSISIIIINWNYAAYLPIAVNSALAQTRSTDQVVIVDDGSTDNSREIIARYGSAVTGVLQPQGGHVRAMNAGYAASTGDLCIFLDADDYLYPNCVERVLDAWPEGAVKLQFRLDTIDRDGVDQAMPFPNIGPFLTPAAVLAQSLMSSWYPWTVSTGNAYSRAFLDGLMPIDAERIYRSPDGYLNKMAPLFGEVHSLSDILGAYRVHGRNAWAQADGASSAGTALRWLNFDRALEGAFIEAAEAKNLKIRRPLIASLQQIEYRLQVVRFAPRQGPFPKDTAFSVWKEGLYSAARSPNFKWPGRILWWGWLTTMAFAPKSLLSRLAARGRLQAGRSGFWKKLLDIAKGRGAGAGPSKA